VEDLASRIVGYRPVGADGPVTTDMTGDLTGPDNRPLEAVYDLAAVAREIDRDKLPTDVGPMWRWQFLLPVHDPANIVTMHEGGTPLFHAERLGRELGLKHLYVKDESRNPTGSFKDRGASVTVSKCREVGTSRLVLASSGNAAAAFNAYATRADLQFFGFLRDDTSETILLHNLVCGRHIFVVEGTMIEGVALANELAARYGFFHCYVPHNLHRIEGKKTIAFELGVQLGWNVPDRILIPTSGGTNVVALYKGYRELKALGWIDRLPAFDIVQPVGCAPIHRAWEDGGSVRRWTNPRTRLLGLGHPFPSTGDEIVQIMHETGGRTWLVTDEQAYDAAARLGRTEGLFLQPASAAPIAALAAVADPKLARELRRQVLVIIGTGSGKNDYSEALGRLPKPPRIQSSLEALEAVAGGSLDEQTG
jgi:threonine synthase